jgi:hypothetical protein
MRDEQNITGYNDLCVMGAREVRRGTDAGARPCGLPREARPSCPSFPEDYGPGLPSGPPGRVKLMKAPWTLLSIRNFPGPAPVRVHLLHPLFGWPPIPASILTAFLSRHQ